MREISGQGGVDTQSLVNYIIQGIPDGVRNKATLCGARNMQQLKERFKQHEAMKRDMKVKTKFEKQKSRGTESIVKPAKTEKSEKPSQSGDVVKKTRCFNCGDKEHMCAECPNKSRGRKCFKYREYGHIASKCDNPGKSFKEVYNARNLSWASCKGVKIGNFELNALIDTSSELTLMRADQYVKIGAARLGRKIVEYRGIGSERNCTLGEFSTNILIDDESYDIKIHVIPNIMMRRPLLIGTDLLDTVEVSMKGETSPFVE